MLDKILDKLGIYDLLAVLLTGVIISVTTILYSRFLDFQFVNDLTFDTNGVLLFLLISYFIGLIFQELGSSIQKHFIFKKNKLLLDTIYHKEPVKLFGLKILEEKNDYVYLTEFEWRRIVRFVNRKLNLNRNSCYVEVIYNYCKHHVLYDKDSARLDKDQSMSAMGRSLSIYFFFCFIFFLGGYISKGFNLCFWDINYVYIIYLNISLTLILFLRGIRFAKMRYAKILRLFYYQNVASKPN